MKSVGIKVLKDNLSKYLLMVREGETILVTDRDEVIAEIQKPVLPYRDPWEFFLQTEEKKGSIVRAKPGKAKPLTDLLSLTKPDKPVNLQALLDDVRAD